MRLLNDTMITTNRVVLVKVPTIADVRQVTRAPQPTPPWSIFWDDASNTPMYRHMGTNTVVATHDKVLISNHLAAMPDPGPGWVKRWQNGRGVYRRVRGQRYPADAVDCAYESKTTAFSITEVQHSNEQLALRLVYVNPFNEFAFCRMVRISCCMYGWMVIDVYVCTQSRCWSLSRSGD